MKKLFNYLRETKGEMKHVNWPTKQQTIAYTSLVVIISIAVSIYLGFFDFLFVEGIGILAK